MTQAIHTHTELYIIDIPLGDLREFLVAQYAKGILGDSTWALVDAEVLSDTEIRFAFGKV